MLFIVGCARTGSTLLRHVLQRSSRVCLASETHFMSEAGRRRLKPRLARIAAGDEAQLDGLLAELFSESFWPFLRRNSTPDEFRERLLATELTERALFTLLLRIHAERRCTRLPDLIIGEKSPEHLYHVPRLLDWFPGARIIHTFRDPRAVYASGLRRVREGRWGPKAAVPWLPQWLLDPLLPALELARATRAWTDAARLDRRYAGSLGERYHRVRFEDLVSDPERELRAICVFLAIPFDPGLLEDVQVVGSSFHEERHGPAGFEASAATRWRTEVSPFVRRWFELVAGRQMGRYGYVDGARGR